MSYASDRGAEAVERAFGLHGGSSGTYAQGATSIAFTNGWRGPVVRSGRGGPLDQEQCAWRIEDSVLTVNPSPGDTITDASGVVWTVEDEQASVREIFFGAAWHLETTRAIQRGAA